MNNSSIRIHFTSIPQNHIRMDKTTSLAERKRSNKRGCLFILNLRWESFPLDGELVALSIYRGVLV